MRPIATVRDVRNLVNRKGIATIAVADDGGISAAIAEQSVPSGETQIHHTIPEKIIERLQELGHTSLDIDGCPAMVLDQIDHTGLQPWTENAPHNQMNAWNNGVLYWENVEENNDAQELVNELIKFYKNECPGWEKAIRGWANVNGLPFTE